MFYFPSIAKVGKFFYTYFTGRKSKKAQGEKMNLRIGKKIIELRKTRGMTQEQLAAALGVTAPAVSKWETDSSYPDITLLCPLARALGTGGGDGCGFPAGF